jgi:hypothetical protein
VLSHGKTQLRDGIKTRSGLSSWKFPIAGIPGNLCQSGIDDFGNVDRQAEGEWFDFHVEPGAFLSGAG